MLMFWLTLRGPLPNFRRRVMLEPCMYAINKGQPMLREIGVAVPLLIVLTVVVLLVVLSQTTEFGVLSSGSVGVTESTALTWGENADLAAEDEDAQAGESEMESEATEAVTDEATEEATEAAGD